MRATEASTSSSSSPVSRASLHRWPSVECLAVESPKRRSSGSETASSEGVFLPATGGHQRQRLSVETLFKIIKALEKGIPRQTVMRAFQLKHSSNVTTILKRKESILRVMAKGTKVCAKAIRSSKYPLIDEHMTAFVAASRASGQRLSRQQLTDHALSLSRTFGLSCRGFKASKGYIDKFLQEKSVSPASPAPLATTPAAETRDKSIGSLQERLLHSVRSFLQQHVCQACKLAAGVFKESSLLSDEELLQLTQTRNSTLDQVSQSAVRTVASLEEACAVLPASRAIDVAEQLLQQQINLTHSLLINLIHFSRDIHLRSLRLDCDLHVTEDPNYWCRRSLVESLALLPHLHP